MFFNKKKTDWQPILEKAENLRKRSRYAEAISLLEANLDYAKDSRAMHELSQLLLHSGEYRRFLNQPNAKRFGKRNYLLAECLASNNNLASPIFLKSHPPLPNAAYISMVKDESDIVEVSVRHALRLFDEMLVVDNGSTDGTAEAARARGAVVVSEPQRGYGAAGVGPPRKRKFST